VAAAVAAAAVAAAAAQSLPHCCHHPPPLCSSSLSASSFPFSSPAALSAGRRSPVFNALWLVVVCACPLPSLSASVSLAVGRWLISLLLCRRRLAPLLLFAPPRPHHRGHRCVVAIVDAVRGRRRLPSNTFQCRRLPTPAPSNAGAVRCGLRRRRCPGQRRRPVGRREAMAEDALMGLKC
jgi:hypothetical protein